MAPLNEESVQDIAAEGQEVELTPEQKTAQLAQLMSEGKRELRAGNFEKAGEKFGEAAEFTAQHYGTFAAESYEPNLMYGRTLNELSVVESDLFKNALVNIVKKEEGDQDMEEKDGDESMTEEEKEDVRDLVAEALAQNAEELEKKETEGTEDEEKNDDEAKGDVAGEDSKDKTDDKAEEEKESTDEAVAGDSKEEGKMEDDSAENEEKEEAMEEEEGAEKEDIEDGDEEDEEEDLDNNQLAWEALEVAAKIADKMMEEEGGSAEWKRKKADVFVQLAQCAANDEKYEMALEDLVRARDLMTEIETETKKGDRLTAEIYFHEGRINRLRNEFALAEESFNKATAAMETLLNGVKTDAGDSPTDIQKEEIHEMEEIIKDFKERAEDCKGSEVQKKMMATLAEKDNAEQPSILTTSNANSDPTANDISGLVRKKRAHDESEMEGAPKRGKSEEAEERGEENIAV